MQAYFWYFCYEYHSFCVVAKQGLRFSACAALRCTRFFIFKAVVF